MIKEKVTQLKKAWASMRQVGGATFAGLEKLKAFKNGKTLTNSARSTFLNCRKKYQFSYVYGLAPRKPSVPFLVGGLFHNELDVMYTDKEFDAQGARKRVGEACEKASQMDGLVPEDSEKIFMQQAIVMGMLKGYAQLYLKRDLAAWEIVDTEEAFKISLPNDWNYQGKKDMVIRERKTKRLLLVEHKTAGRLDAGYVAKLPLDNQILGYTWASREKKVVFDGVLYNVVKKPSIRQKDSESLNQFYKRVEDEYLLDPGKYFYRETLGFSKKDVDRFGDELGQFTGEVDRCHSENYFYQNTSQCTAMGVCPFMKLCTDGVSKETLMMYRVKDRPHEELPAEED